MAVTYQTEGVKMPDIKKRETTEWIKNVAASYGKRLGEIAYIFCSDEKILEVNRQYLAVQRQFPELFRCIEPAPAGQRLHRADDHGAQIGRAHV